MKSLCLILSLSFCADLFATVRTVNNVAGSTAQYTTIQAAVNASASGDTIYVHGSADQYAGFTIADKRLVVIGPGWSPMQNFAPFKASVYDITISGAGASNTEIQGLHIVTNIAANSYNHPDGLRFYRNQFKGGIYIGTGTFTYSNFVFEGNWFDGGSINAAQSCYFINFLFKNNIFYLSNSNGSVSGMSNCSNVIFDHNLWYGPSGNATVCFTGNCRYLLLTNNIFVRRNAAANNTLSTFNNNITFNAGVNDPWSQTYSNNGLNNIENQDPQMVAQLGVNAGTNDPLQDFTITAGPANNSGTDGKDMGLLYDAIGSLNWTNSRMSRLPFVYSMNISNPNISAGGTLTVQVEARKNN